MELRELAERVLFGDTLADKLFDPGPLTDERPGASQLPPDVPGRPVGLRFDDPRPRPPAPRPRDLDDPAARGRVLHAMANHELLAMELMAAMLLRFVDAPRGWRAGLGVTLRDEQKHLQLYLERMAAVGTEPGGVPVSSFFWDTLISADDPLRFTAAMGLGFEQANLDFALAWQRAFRRVGDHATAEVLQTVYDDEVRHVRHGVRWFRELSGGELDYEAWAAALRFPMSPARARGPRLDRRGRLRAGMPEAFVDAVALRGASRGRPPVVYRVDVGVEERLAGGTPGRAARDVQHDLQHVPLLISAVSDVVIATPPPVELLRRLREAGFTPGEVVQSPEALGERAVERLEPWAWCADATEALQPLAERVRAGPVCHDPRARQVFAKTWAAGWQPFATVARTVDEAQGAATGRFVVKAPWSASGTQRLVGRFEPRAVQRWLDRHGAVVVQPWFDRVVDLSAHGTVDDEGVHFDGVVRFETSRAGVCRALWVGPWLHGLPSEVQRFAHRGGHEPGWVDGRLRERWVEVASAARALGHRGPLGIDALIARSAEGGLELIELIEVNPRWTLGRVAWCLRQRVAGKARGWWRLHRVADLGDPVRWAAEQRAEHPVRLDGERIVAGFVATSVLEQARQVVTALHL